MRDRRSQGLTTAAKTANSTNSTGRRAPASISSPPKTPLQIQAQMRQRDGHGREVSERRQVGDAASMVNMPSELSHDRSDKTITNGSRGIVLPTLLLLSIPLSWDYLERIIA
ncbi:hypothetical protein CMQ_4314 [Grosmannia clavigera kw1407]|uniref:Uncharacterized protein n=1 Tax=Grosmannia clavigera (strain kw1407 / UAMH 11150) TaxID=655863 RepID=F0XTU6_GROCL|nr:uncharacterized protein CMQ_4314 [Grosmannia clavigera kw1407]EFW98462.1 hypothetical protein CMQ_4314 [Grosmannia clavigera kw1407]